jgi:hypothetical protein
VHEFYAEQAPPGATRVVEGSHGRLYVNEDGHVIEYMSHADMGCDASCTGYSEIARVNLPEFDAWNNQYFNGDGWDTIDILHVGTWDKDGMYESADDGAREMSLESLEE